MILTIFNFISSTIPEFFIIFFSIDGLADALARQHRLKNFPPSSRKNMQPRNRFRASTRIREEIFLVIHKIAINAFAMPATHSGTRALDASPIIMRLI
jgi:hypothetical protein